MVVRGIANILRSNSITGAAGAGLALGGTEANDECELSGVFNQVDLRTRIRPRYLFVPGDHVLRSIRTRIMKNCFRSAISSLDELSPQTSQMSSRLPPGIY